MTDAAYELAYRRLVHHGRYALLVANAERLAALLRKAGYHPDQPRVPRGEPDGGQWTDEGGGETEDGWLAALQRRLPEPLFLASDDPSLPPQVPEEPPTTTRERNIIARAVAEFIVSASAAGDLEFAQWVYDHAHDPIIAYLEPARTLDELYVQGLGPKAGFDLHHVVERVSARDGFSQEMINSPDNNILVPTYRHWQITEWFNTINTEYGNISPREFLRTEPWSTRRKVGLDALREAGVLK